ncbi:MAG: DUF2812 domain-containing protein [Oscillospiraceae bacterium]|nr:DUF2812 domain-containing protein [Oscillospiraceae bacterium]
MKQKVRRMFWPWNYKKELAAVNERSAEGWHMTACSRFSRTEAQEEGVSYRYALDCREQGGFTEKLYEKQGWELVCRLGAWLWFRKKIEEGRMESEYVLHGGERHAIEDHLHGIVKPLDTLRNLLLVISGILIVVLTAVAESAALRYVVIPLLLAAAVVKYAENIRKALGEEKRK